VHNVDFEYNIERQKDRPKIAGMILEFGMKLGELILATFLGSLASGMRDPQQVRQHHAHHGQPQQQALEAGHNRYIKYLNINANVLRLKMVSVVR
jgi:hypothetical protein